MQAFRFKSHEVLGADDERLEAALAAAHAAKFRPLCVCTNDGVAMYVAHVGEHYLVKRMPNSGHLHDASCDSYDPPGELSGLGDVAGSAIQEDLATGTTTLKLDFALTKRAGGNAPQPSGAQPDTVRTDGQRLTLRGLLHHLWERAELNRWTPGMSGRRSWGVVQRRLLAAAQHTVAKGEQLCESLFVPEPWNSDREDQIRRTRRSQLARLHGHEGGARKRMVLIGELQEITTAQAARSGFAAVIKHLTEMPLKVADDLDRRISRRFERELALWEGDKSTHMILVGTFTFNAAGYAELDEVSLMPTDAQWIPVEHLWDLELTSTLAYEGRRFSKCLRYNLASDRPMANAVLNDTGGDCPVTLYVVPPETEAEAEQALTVLREGSPFPSWVWRAGDDDMPALPSRASLAPGRHSGPEAGVAEFPAAT